MDACVVAVIDPGACAFVGGAPDDEAFHLKYRYKSHSVPVRTERTTKCQRFEPKPKYYRDKHSRALMTDIALIIADRMLLLTLAHNNPHIVRN